MLDALARITKEAGASEKGRSLIARTGGLFAVVRAMECHTADTHIQIAGCHALEKLALDTDNEIAIEQVGGVEAILAAMMGHFDNAEVHEAAWAALWNLTCSNASKELTLDTAGGMQAIVAAMKSHMESPPVQKNACGALANLCQNNPKRMEAFAEANGFVVIATVLERYWSKPDVRTEACHAMTALCEGYAGRASKSTALTGAHSAPLMPLPSPTPSRSPAGADRSWVRLGSSGSSNSGPSYLPGGYFAKGVAAVIPGSTSNQHQHMDLQSLASMSFYEEETVYE